ncbi:MAG: PA3715 family protein [Lysobacter sp.]
MGLWWLLAAVIGAVALPAGAATPPVQFSAATPVRRADALPQADFDAIVAEAMEVASRPRTTSVVPLPAHWRTLDRARLLAMLVMPAFARIPESYRGVLLDQAATWDLLSYRRPSDAAALWERVWPRAAHVDSGEAPNSSGIGYQPDPTWSPTATAITTLFNCFPRAVWGAPEDPAVWAVRQPVAWQWRNEQGWDGFRDCVPTQFWDDTRPTPAGMKALLAVLKAKLGDELLSDGCSRPGPDSCLLLFQALFSLDRRNPRLSRILKVMEPAFVDTPIPMPAVAESQRGDERSPADVQALGVAEAEVLRRTIFLTLKLPVLLREPAAWPGGELQRSLEQATRLAVQLARIQHLHYGRHQLFERYYADPWQWVDARVDAAVASRQRELGASYARQEACALAELEIKGGTPSFWQGYVLDNIRRSHGDCGRFDDLRLAQVYRAAQAAGHGDAHVQSMHPLAPIVAELAAGGALHERALDAMAATCSASKHTASDPWNLCADVAARAATRKAVEDAEQAEAARARVAEQRARRLSADCEDGMAARAATALGYQDDEDFWSGGFTACRLDPLDHRRAIVALSYRAGEQLAGQAPVDSESNYDLDVVLMNVATGAIVAHRHRSAAIESDAIRYEGIGIDTARYLLAPGKRAFGIRTAHGAHCYQCVYSYSQMTLYLQDGKRIDPVLDLQVAEATDASTETCPEGIGHADTTLTVGTGRSHGLADLEVKTTMKVERYSEDGASATCGSDEVTTAVARFDGHAYDLPGGSDAPP